MRTPLGFYVDHPIGDVGFAKPPDGLVGHVEVWLLGAARMRTPPGFYVDHPIGGVGFAKHPDGLAGRVEGWLLGATLMRAWTNHFAVGFSTLILNRFARN